MADTATETEALIALMARHGMAEFSYDDGSRSIRIVNGVVQANALSGAEPNTPSPPTVVIPSPAVGRFRRRGAEAFPLTVTEGEIIGFVTAGLLRLPVTAPEAGMVLSACHADDTGVGYETPLFEFTASR